MDWLMDPMSIFQAARQAVSPVDATQGSQGAPQGVQSDGSMLGNVFQTVGDFGRGLSQEGLGGLLDPGGMMDRQNAQRELASRFNVIPDGTPGIRTENQVSPEEYQRIAREYSDIRLGRTDLQLGQAAGQSDPDYAAFRTGAMSDIADIMQTESGRGLIGSLAHAPLQADGTTHRVTTLDERVDAHGAADPSNAEGGGMFGVSGYAHYVPGQDTLASRDNLRSDVTLYHELTHAHHAVYNTWDGGVAGDTATDTSPQEDIDASINLAEHQAAGIGLHANDQYSENRYRGERRVIGGLGVGARTTGAETDADMTHRDTYSYHGARTNPATVPGAPSTATGSAGGPGSGGAVGQASPVDHD